MYNQQDSGEGNKKTNVLPAYSIRQRYRELHTARFLVLERQRKSAEMTIPSLLPPISQRQQDPLRQPYSSEQARGVTGLASKILSALLPLDQTSFFQFDPADTRDAQNDQIIQFLDELTRRVYSK